MARALDIHCQNEAEISDQLAGQKRKLDDRETRRRQKIRINPQQAFINVEMIHQALVEEEREEIAAETFAARRGRTQARQTAQMMQNRQIAACIHEFSIRDTE